MSRPDPGGAPVLFIGSEIYRASSYGQGHPLAIPRVSTCIDLCRDLGWLPERAYIDSPRADANALARFHTPNYIAAVQRAERDQRLSTAASVRYNLGRNGNPIFPEVFSRPATACGASLLAADLLAAENGPRAIFSPAGGTHHGLPDRASGFCYFNDPVLAILRLLDLGIERVLYLDVDAHHGDGVQLAFHSEARVLCLSLHEEGRWPMVTRKSTAPKSTAPKSTTPGLGEAADRGGGHARNFPMPAAFHDDEMAYVMHMGVRPLVADFAPQITVLQCGADGLADDPLSKLGLSNLALWRVVAEARTYAPKLLVLGGGGYNPWTVARCWTGIWAVLNDLEMVERLPRHSEARLRAINWRHSLARNPPESWFTELADRPRGGPIRDAVRRTVARALAAN